MEVELGPAVPVWITLDATPLTLSTITVTQGTHAPSLGT